MTRTEELRLRLLGTGPTDRLWGWLGPGLIALVGGVLRFWNLDRPDALVFDETYYVKQGYSLLRFGVEMRVLESLKEPDAAFTGGSPDVFSRVDGDMVVHPPVGKWVIGGGEWLLGVGSGWGWRFSVALVGTLSILVVGRVGRRLFGSTALGCVAAFLLAFEGSHFVMSRTGILDIIVSFFALCGFAALARRPRPQPGDPRREGGRPAARHLARRGRAVARLAAVALGRRALARAGDEHEVVGPVLPRRVRADVGVVGPRGAAGGRRAPVGSGRAAARRAVRGPGDGRHVGGRLRRVVDRLVPLRQRLPPPVEHVPPRRGRAVAAAGAAQLAEVPPGRLQLQHDAADPAPVPVEPVVVDGADPTDVVLLREPGPRRWRAARSRRARRRSTRSGP